MFEYQRVVRIYLPQDSFIRHEWVVTPVAPERNVAHDLNYGLSVTFAVEVVALNECAVDVEYHALH